MEMTTALVLFSFIVIAGYLANKLIDRKYGSKPNQELINRLDKIESELWVLLPSRLTGIDQALANILTEIPKLSARIDGVQIKKAFNLESAPKEVTHL